MGNNISRFLSVRFPDNLVTKLVLQYLKNYAIGAGVSGIFSIWNLLIRTYNIVRKKRKNEEEVDTQTLLTKYIDNAKNTGRFLGSWGVLFEVLLRILHIRQKGRPLFTSAIVAGILSGFLAQWQFNGVSWKVSLYCLLRAALGLYRSANIPSPEIITVIVYALINTALGWFFYYAPTYVDKQYGFFVSDLAMTSVKGVDSIARHKGPGAPQCQVEYHKNIQSCTDAAIQRTVLVFQKTAKLYGSVHLATTLIKIILTRKLTLKTIKRLITNIIYSTLFLGVQVAVCGPTPCYHKAILPNSHSKTLMLVPWFLGPISILFEQASRRAELSLYCSWRLLTSCINYASNLQDFYNERMPPMYTKIISSSAFGIATGLWLLTKSRNPKSLKKLDQLILNVIFQDPNRAIIPKVKPSIMPSLKDSN
mmetsp:Transcript_3628/g.5360  ORF Transcript_3628/g.5360 Transcript_3628/m.5360 type:complete len:421 (+) Transcript_3628:83-1345(+)